MNISNGRLRPLDDAEGLAVDGGLAAVEERVFVEQVQRRLGDDLDRRIVWGFAFSDLSVTELAEALGVTRTTVYNRRAVLQERFPDFF